MFLLLALVSCAAMGDRMEARRWHDLGLEHSEAGRNMEAEESFRRAISISPGYAGAHDGLGRVYLDTGRNEEAIESFERAVELKPGNVGYLKNLAEAYARTSRYQKSIKTLTRALELRPGDSGLRFSLGMVYLMKGDRALAMEEYKVLRRTDPELAAELWELILR
jgi:tetratricopeptide (TPR) repeat protein